jgi:hypothetical protein
MDLEEGVVAMQITQRLPQWMAAMMVAATVRHDVVD